MRIREDDNKEADRPISEDRLTYRQETAGCWQTMGSTLLVDERRDKTEVAIPGFQRRLLTLIA